LVAAGTDGLNPKSQTARIAVRPDDFGITLLSITATERPKYRSLCLRT
jgi:hypothetical protein